jgi:hypothetical protein
MAIQCFEGCHYEALLIIVVVRKISQQQTFVPFVMIVQHTSSKHIFKNLIHSLLLTIGLRMISQTVDQMCPQRSMQLLPKNKQQTRVLG